MKSSCTSFKDGEIPRYKQLFKRDLLAGLEPRVFCLPDGRVFLIILWSTRQFVTIK